MLAKTYHFDKQKRIWIGNDAETFNYSDGAEAFLLQKLDKIKDKSVFSSELLPLQNNWPLQYHLSHSRANLLRPFAKKLIQKARILELGCGCGAITRYLGETAKQVFAVEGSPLRAEIAAKRCNDLANVSVIADKIQNLPEEIGKFDLVTLIGVLEYSGNFGQSPIELLRLSKKFLAKGGSLILALENRLGVKYFAGVPEDHLRISWAGITDGYKKDGVMTWSRKELIDMLTRVGFENTEQFIPLPDYKLPATIITESGIKAGPDKLNLEALLAGRQRIYEKTALFNLQAAWHSILKAGLLPDLADSMCFIANNLPNPDLAHDSRLLAVHYGNSPHADKAFAKTVSIIDEGQQLIVKRKKLFPQIKSKSSHFSQIIQDEPYYHGMRIGDLARHCLMRKNWTSRDLANILEPWAKHLLSLADKNGLIDGKYLDLTPFNIIIDEKGKTHAFDMEWKSNAPLSVSFLLARGLAYTFPYLSPVAMPAENTDTCYGLLIKEIFNHYSLKYDDQEIEKCWNENSIENFLNLTVLSWKETKEKNLYISLENPQSLLPLAGLCANMELPPERLKEYVIELQNNIAKMQSHLKLMQKMIEKLKS